MSDYKYILFDLDGTITEPGLGITNSIMYALNKMGISVSDRSELYKFIGPPLWESFQNFYGFSNDEADKAVEYYREYYKDKGMLECTINEGIEPLLQNLRTNGKSLIVATSKPEIFAKQVLSNFNLDSYFNYIAGSNLDRTRSEKDEVISYALESCKINDKQFAIMIGDRKHDITGARKNNIRSIGVLFGYGSREELENAGADYIAENAKDIDAILLN